MTARLGMTFSEFVADNRKRAIAHARQDAMRAVREATNLSLPAIGRIFGGRDHTTILDGIRASEKRERKS